MLMESAAKEGLGHALISTRVVECTTANYGMDGDPRTTNAIEGYNHRLRNVFRPHGSFYPFMRTLLAEQKRIDADIARVVSGRRLKLVSKH
jgi:hypothetical protein